MTELRRSIGVGRATAMVVGILIGASIFVQPSAIMMKALNAINVSETDRAAILGGNAARVYKLS